MVSMVKICGNSVVVPLSMTKTNSSSSRFLKIVCVMVLTQVKEKQSNVYAVHKRDSKNYRPISLLSVFDKTSEKILHHSLYDYFNSNQILNNSQSGFRKGDSCVA